MATHKDIALVLSGGAARGLAHVGVIQELEAQGFHIKSITGTSMGALIGAFYAMNKLDEFVYWIKGMNRYSFIRLMDFSFRGGFLKGEKVLNILQSKIPGMRIEDFSIPYRCVATDIITQKSVTFDSGDIYKAIRASIAIPTIFTPVFSEDRILVDGGVLNNIPVDLAIKTAPSDIVVAVDVNARVPLNHDNGKWLKKKPNLFRLSNHVISLMTEQLAILKLKNNPPDFMINVSRFSCELYEFYKAERQIEFGRACAKKELLKYPF